MRWVLLAMVLGGCIQEADRTRAPIHPEVECGKCVLIWTQTLVRDDDGFNQRCIQYTETGVLCCPYRGDVGCPLDSNGYELRECDDFTDGACLDSDARTDYCVEWCPGG